MIGLRVALVVRGHCGPTFITWWRAGAACGEQCLVVSAQAM
jgi:hypothetical protein